MRVEGVSISATARLTGRSRNTVARWLERASIAAELFNRRMVRDFDIVELQADELYTFIGSKSRPMWLFATIEVCSRLWASSLVGRRSYRNTKAVLNDVILRGRLVGIPLIATDGFEFYFAVIGRLMGPACVYGQVVKTRRNNRVVRVERRAKIGTTSRLEEALFGVGGFREAKHVVRRTSKPHDPARLSVLAPALALPRPMRRPAPLAC